MNSFLKDYLLSLKNFFLFSFFFFLLSVLLGYWGARIFPSQTSFVIFLIKQTIFDFFPKENSFLQVLFVFFNNCFTILMVLLLSVLGGIFPLLVLFVNGSILGMLIYSLKEKYSLFLIILAILPHGIFEFLAVFLSCALGIKMGLFFWQETLGKNITVNLKENLKLNFLIFLYFMLPLLLIAALVEIFITPLILKLVL